MYKVYIDKEIVSANKRWNKLLNHEDSETVIYSGFSDLILKLEIKDKNIIYFSEFKNQVDMYEKN